MERDETRSGRSKQKGTKFEKEFDIDRKRDDDLNVDYDTLRGVPKPIKRYYTILNMPHEVSDSQIEWKSEGEVQINFARHSNDWNLPFARWQEMEKRIEDEL
jgi:hypothetical protein